MPFTMYKTNKLQGYIVQQREHSQYSTITLFFIFLIFIYLFWLCWVLVAVHGLLVAACGLLVAACMQDLVTQPGIEPGPPALGAWSPTHWATREVPQ